MLHNSSFLRCLIGSQLKPAGSAAAAAIWLRQPRQRCSLSSAAGRGNSWTGHGRDSIPGRQAAPSELRLAAVQLPLRRLPQRRHPAAGHLASDCSGCRQVSAAAQPVARQLGCPPRLVRRSRDRVCLLPAGVAAVPGRWWQRPRSEPVDPVGWTPVRGHVGNPAGATVGVRVGAQRPADGAAEPLVLRRCHRHRRGGHRGSHRGGGPAGGACHAEPVRRHVDIHGRRQQAGHRLWQRRHRGAQ
uniref:Secreted protein n=1 Tax=Macrostomum lignano TaxID=282301 RepID=A0A1I8FD05_9PLAT